MSAQPACLASAVPAAGTLRVELEPQEEGSAPAPAGAAPEADQA